MTDAEQVLRDYTAMWNEQDASRIPDLVSESIALYNPTLPEGEVYGHDGFEEWMQAVTSAFPDFRVETLDLLAGEDTVMTEVEYTMTHRGEFNGIPPTDREVQFQAMAKFRIDDGKVQEHRDYIDRQEFLEQLGLAEG